MENEPFDHTLINDLFGMLRWRRPGGSKTEDMFNKKYLDSILGMKRDGFGNRFIEIANHDGSRPTIMWSCHTDTVHTQGGMQKIAWDPIRAEVFLSKKETISNCLGADCTVGVWIMRRMIFANVPGLYVFHAMEEKGGLGSKHFAKTQVELLSGLTHAIAFDRRGDGSVITHQLSGRTASEAFAKSMAELLSGFDPSLQYDADATGVYTDTVNYTDLIGECSNLSVGYSNEHSSSEMLDVAHAQKLMSAMVSIDFSSLVALRQPAELDPDDYMSGGWIGAGRRWTGGWSGHYSEDKSSNPSSTSSVKNLYEFCRYYPYTASELLASLGLTLEEAMDFLDERHRDSLHDARVG